MPINNAKAAKWIGMRKRNGQDEMFINPEIAPEILTPLGQKKVNLISIFGSARQGKSFLMNLLSGKQDLFKISNQREPCTQGVDISTSFSHLSEFSSQNGCQQVNGDTLVGYVDAEGQGDRDITYDSRLVSPILLASKCVIFNWKDSLQADRMLNLLAVLARAAQGIEQADDGKKVFGHLHIVFRDWNFVNSTPDQVYNDLFKKEKGRSSEIAVRNQARTTLVESFETITVWLFPPPVANTINLSSKIRFDQLQSSFQVKLREFRMALSKQMRTPVYFNKKPITAKSLGKLMPALVDVLNSDEIIMPEPIFVSMMKAEMDSLYTHCEATIKEIVQKEKTSSRLVNTNELLQDMNLRIEALIHETAKELLSFPPEMKEETLRRLNEFKNEQINRLQEFNDQRLTKEITQSCSRFRQQLTVGVKSIEDKLPVDESELKEAFGDLYDACEHKIIALPELSDPSLLDGELERLQEFKRNTLDRLVMQNKHMLDQTIEKMKKTFEKTKKIFSLEATALLDEKWASGRPFTIAMLKTEVLRLGQKALDSLVFTEGGFNGAGESIRSDMEQHIEDAAEKCTQRYEKEIRNIVAKISSDTRSGLEKEIRETVTPCLPMETDTLREYIDEAVKKMKLHAATTLQGWSVPKVDMSQLGDVLDDMGEMNFTLYLEKNSRLDDEMKGQEELKLYSEAKETLTKRAKESIEPRLPLDEDEIEELFVNECKNAAKEHVSTLKQLKLKEYTVDVITGKLEKDMGSLMEQMKLLNSKEMERIKFLEIAENERNLREKNLEESKRNNEKINEMQRLVNSALQSKDEVSTTLSAELRAREERTKQLEEELMNMKLKAQKDEEEREALRVKALKEAQKRETAEAAAEAAAKAAELAAKAAVDAAKGNRTSIVEESKEIERPKRKREVTPTKEQVISTPRRRASARRASMGIKNTPRSRDPEAENLEEVQVKRPRTRRSVPGSTESSPAKENNMQEKSEIKKASEDARAAIQSRIKSRCQGIRKSSIDTPSPTKRSPASGKKSKTPKTKMTLEEARKAAQAALHERIEKRTAALGRGKR